MIQAVFLDIDNTLASPTTRSIPQSAREAIARARAKGIRVFVATGRNTLTREEGGILDGLELDGCVSSNGQLCYLPDGETVHILPLDGQDVEIVLRFCRHRHMPLLISEREGNYITMINETVRAFHNKMHIDIYPLRQVDSLAGRQVLSVAPYGDAVAERELRALLRRSTTVRFNPDTFDVIPEGGGKDMGIERMAARFGIPLSRCLAMGDGGNDIAMLRAAGVGVAMAGSDEEVLRAADEIAPSPDEDGLWKTFERHGLL